MMGALRADIARFIDHDQPLTLGLAIRKTITEFGLHAMVPYRLGRALLRAHHKWYLWPLLPIGWPVYYLLSRYVRIGYDVKLELTADIGRGLYIGHFGDIRLRHCRLGQHCSIGQSVYIEPAEDGRQPVIGNNVWIGAHAKVCGPYSVGSGSTLSACAIVRSDIGERALCVGNPARIFMRGYDNKRLLNVVEP